jgi:hypothetical protein
MITRPDGQVRGLHRAPLPLAWLALLASTCLAGAASAPASPARPTPAGPAAASQPAVCVSSGDGYLRARLAGAIDADVDWPNSGTHCEGEARRDPPGVRLSFARPGGSNPDLLFVFGISGVHEGAAGHALGVNLTVIEQGSGQVFGTLGDARCTIDSLTQRELPVPTTWRVEARGFCTQPAHAIRGEGALLVSRFDFAGVVSYPRDDAKD